MFFLRKIFTPLAFIYSLKIFQPVMATGPHPRTYYMEGIGEWGKRQDESFFAESVTF